MSVYVERVVCFFACGRGWGGFWEDSGVDCDDPDVVNWGGGRVLLLSDV